MAQTGRNSIILGKGAKVGIIVAFAAILIGLLIVMINDRNQLKQQVSQLSASQANTKADSQKYIDSVNKLLVPPAGVTPTINTPSDAALESLKSGNKVFSNINKGDVFLVYEVSTTSQFVVVYRPLDNKILLALPVDKSGTSTQPTNSPKR